MGVPGVLGCCSIDGEKFLWNPLLHPQYGLQSAFTNLSIDVAGLPAARIASEVRLPKGCGWCGLFRGGSSYHSCAVVWQQSLGDGAVVERSDIGNECRLWVCVAGTTDVSLYVCTVAFPTAGCHHDDRWIAELTGLGNDLSILCEGDSKSLSHVVIQGDFNFQPPVLGGPGVSDSARRRSAWNSFMDEWDLLLHNPPFHGDVPDSILLPLRGRSVDVYAGSTRHGPTAGRAIDLVMSSRDVCLDMVIHNGRGCGGHGCCQWEFCTEYAGGDHFLIVLEIEFLVHKNSQRAAPVFPPWWHDQTRWQLGFDAAEAPLAQLHAWLEKTFSAKDFSSVLQCLSSCGLLMQLVSGLPY